jgi:hypothetical protein
MDALLKSNRGTAKTFGIFFLIGYIAYIIGNILANSPENLSYIYAHKPQVILGAILMSTIETFFNMGVVVIILPLFRRYNKTITYGYFTAAIMATVMMVIGAVFLLLQIPISDEFVKAGSGDTHYLQILSTLCMKGNFFSYQTAMAIWGLGGLLFCYLLYKSQLVPRFLSICGFIGYIIFISGSLLAMFGYSVDVIMDIPGGLFELTLAIYLITKGFNPSAFAYAFANN